MEMKILAKTKEPLLSRTRISAEASFEGRTPSNEEVRKSISALTHSEEKLVVVKKIGNSFGKKLAKISASVYDDEASLKSIEGIKEKKAADKPAEAK